MNEADMQQLAVWIDECLRSPEDEATLSRIKGEVMAFCEKYPVPGID